MATIETRHGKKRTSYRVIWYRNGDRHSQTCDTIDEAHTWKMLIEQTAGDADAASRALLRKASDAKTFTEAAQHRLDRSRVTAFTRQEYSGYMKRYLDSVIGAIPIDHVTEDDLWNVIKAMDAKGLAPKTIRNVFGFVASVFEHALSQGWIQASPYRAEILPKDGVRNEDDMFLTRQEVQLILSHQLAHVDASRVMLATGLRPGELVALNVEHVNLDADTPSIRVRQAMKQDREKGDYIGVPKSKRSIRSAGLPPSAVDVIRPHLEGKTSGMPVFTSRTGARLSQKVWYKAWSAAVKRAQNDLENGPLRKSPPLYSLRHTHASLMLDAGMSIWKLSRHLGHGSVQITEDVYAHLMPDAHYEAAGYAEKALGEGPVPEIATP